MWSIYDHPLYVVDIWQIFIDNSSFILCLLFSVDEQVQIYSNIMYIL